MTRIVVVSAGLSNPSSTRLLADLIGDATVTAGEARGSAAELEHVELRHLAHAMTNHLLTGFAQPELATAYESLRRADGVVFVTPVFSASYSGLFKMFVDLLEPGLLDGTPVLVAATGGTARHSLVLEHALRPLFSYLHAVVVPTAVFAATDDFGDTVGLRKRAERAATELAALATGALATPTAPRASIEERFENPTDFATLLAQAADPTVIH